MIKRVAGIDVGQKGAVCILTTHEDGTKEATFHPMPLIGTDFDFHELVHIFGTIQDAHVFIEKVTPFKMGATGAFNFGRGCGVLEGMLHAFKLIHSYVTPASWQKIMHEGCNSKLMPDPKQRSLAVARRLFPTMELRKTLLNGKQSKFPDEGFVDALLIAEYGARKNSK